MIQVKNTKKLSLHIICLQKNTKLIVYYYDKWYNVFVTIEFFPHIDIMMVESTINSPDQDTQGLPGVNTFLNLFNHWLLDCLNMFFLD